MPTINRIRPIRTKNPLVIAYCVSVFLEKPYQGEYPTSVYTKQTRCRVPILTRQGRPLCRAVKAILDVPGVTQVGTFDYELQIAIAAAFDWPECHDAIVAAIKQHLYPGVENVEVEELRSFFAR